MKNEYLIAIDGGGTKTLGVLYKIDGQEIKRFSSGYANFSVDVNTSKINLEHTIDSLLEKIDNHNDLVHIQIGVAGRSTLKNAEDYEQYLSLKYNTSVNLTTDAHIALYAIKKDQDSHVIMILGGTGSVIMANDDHEEILMIGGHGHILGDEGSGYHLAISALKKVITEYENDIKYSKLSKFLMTLLHLNDHLDIKHYVYNHQKSDIAKLAKEISKLALKGDVDAIDLLKEEGLLLAKQAIKAYSKIKAKNHLIIALRGKFLLDAPYVKDTLIDYLRQKINDFELDLYESDTVIGGYYLGLEKWNRRNKS